ncbi:alpha/beta superfamily hydrolase [Natronospira proteinivora]|uniref:Alpha/beta superfamily hydrolase n=1 Tax=Natronospira proteinivora TaxID=1807133 RepID=A0ABT1GAP0_9GAMM|nr:alpha/beta fold hydrolase [Natronospira proteinivora]MCP1728389.1 alpha/beta superfamily hydrolase [Natronospira proteinivora]
MAKLSTQGEALAFTGPAGKLEGLLQESDSDEARAIAVVCHPHPLHQGSMHNKVAHTLARACSEAGAVSLRFNFRGVGGSEGEFDEAVGETADALAAVAWMREHYPGLPLWLAGFSFGAQVSLQASPKAGPDRLITVAPPVQRFGGTRPARPDCPWLLLQGEADEVVDPQAVFDWAERYAEPPEIARFPEVGHFFHANLTPLRERVLAFLKE